jgi:hypothetical protein
MQTVIGPALEATQTQSIGCEAGLAEEFPWVGTQPYSVAPRAPGTSVLWRVYRLVYFALSSCLYLRKLSLLRQIISILGLFLLSSLIFPLMLFAQGPSVSWSQPENLSNSPSGSVHPAIVSDKYGNVHVFWSEGVDEISDIETPLPGNAIYYTRWDGQQWTLPTDVLTVPGDPIADHPSAVIDGKARIHVVWAGMYGVYYSSALLRAADSVWSWAQPSTIALHTVPPWSLDLAIDSGGSLYIVYATGGVDPGVYCQGSDDSGATWTSPTRVSDILDATETSLTNVSVLVDREDRVHVVWQSNRQDGYGKALYYTRSTDKAQDWEPPLRFGYWGASDYRYTSEEIGSRVSEPASLFVGWPSLTADNGGGLHLTYVAGTETIGRWHRVSQDGGETWSRIAPILDEMEGVNGYIWLISDGFGQLHLIANMRTRHTVVIGVYYSSWLGDHWSRTVPIDVNSPAAPSAHYADVAVRMGNEIHVVYTQLRGGEIWYVRGHIPGSQPLVAGTRPIGPHAESLLPRESASPQRITAPVVAVPVVAGSPALREVNAWVFMVPSILSALLVCAALLSFRSRG